MTHPFNDARFSTAKPIWISGREREMNLTMGFRCYAKPQPCRRAILRITASTLYRAFANGVFLGYGPARGPHGWFRIDELDVTGALAGKDGITLAIEVAGYNANAFSCIDQPSFLHAELEIDGGIVCASGRAGDFTGFVLEEHVQKVQRFNIMRGFAEVYHLTPGHDAWRVGEERPSVPVDIVQGGATLSRHAPYPDYSIRQPLAVLEKGHLVPFKPKKEMVDRAWLWANTQKLKSFPIEELQDTTFLEVQHVANARTTTLNEPYSPKTSLVFHEKEYCLVDLGALLTGFPGLSVVCHTPTRIIVRWDELLTDGDIRYRESEGVNAIVYDLAPGTYSLESFEPYTLRYLKLLCTKGACRVHSMTFRQYLNSETSGASFAASDDRLNRVFDAARETFRQNAVDLFVDCPGRERGGYLCDGFFTARASFALTGNTKIEDNFFENYRLPATFAYLPEGMVPMCYPADHYDGLFIPNWGLWLIVQLDEYAQRSGRNDMVESLRPRVEALFRYFEPFINRDGLLEKLQGWVFVEWSKSNDYLQDVSYATNALYAGALATAGRLYGRSDWALQAEAIKETIRNQAFDGDYFCDNAVRNPDGTLCRTNHHTETCQYYIFFFDVATPASHPVLWKRLVLDFGVGRDVTKTHPDVAPSNAFIGAMLRAEVLARYGCEVQMVDEALDCWVRMAEQTGTLWENLLPSASCCHGFTAHVAFSYYRDVLGIYRVDPINKLVEVKFNEIPIEWCRGRMPVPGGYVELAWEGMGDQRRHTCSVPAGYSLRVLN